MEAKLRNDWGVVGLGLLLIAAGVLFLLSNLGILGIFGGLLWSLAFAGGGMVFLFVFFGNREHWWAVIPGFALLGIAGLIGINTLFPQLGGPWSGSLFLAALATSFLVVRLVRADNWWATIPAGVLYTLSLIPVLPGAMLENLTPGIFFLGLSATFGLVYILPTPQGRMRWAAIPAGIMLAMGLISVAAMSNLANIMWPVLLIGLGGFFTLRALARRPERG